jgi:hypothetical protein
MSMFEMIVTGGVLSSVATASVVWLKTNGWF